MYIIHTELGVEAGVDTQSDPRAPKLHKVVEPQEIQEATGMKMVLPSSERKQRDTL
jgi:hypothetical protein